MEEEFMRKVEEIKVEHGNECLGIKREYEEKIEELERKKEGNVQEMLREIERIKSEHEFELIELSKKFEDDIGSINGLLEDEKEDHMMTKMTKEEKIEYLNTRISEMKEKYFNLEEAKKGLES
jgi:hypothetical protein